MAIFQPQIIGNGGGSGQEIQYDVIPEATVENLGKIIQYVGETIPDVEASATIEQTVGSGLSDLEVDVKAFEETEKPTEDCAVDFVCTEIIPEYLDPTRIWVGGCYLVIDQEKFLRKARNTWPNLDNWNVTHFGVDYHDRQSDGWVFVAYHNDSEIAAIGDDPTMWGVSLEGEVFSDLAFNYFTYYTKATSVWTKNGETVNLADYGVSYTGAPSVDDTISVAYTKAKSGYVNGYFYENQAIYSDPSATISQTAGQIDSISFETISGNTTISGTTQAIINWYTDIGLSQYPSSGTIDITYRDDMDLWSFTSSGGANSTVSQGYFEGLGFVFTGTPVGGEHINCRYTIGNISNIKIDSEQFIETEQPTEDEEVSFVYCGSIPSQLTGTVEGITATIVDVDKFMGQIHEAEQTFGFTANGFTIRVSNHGDTPATWECELEIYHDGTSGTWPIHATYPNWGIELSSESWSPTWTYYSCISNATFIAYWKKNNIETVNLSDYGITYDGSPNIDDELTVYYTAPAVIGYNWIQKDVQAVNIPEVGIDWKTKVDVPENYPSSYRWSCAPIYTVPGGLPDGKYEVYWQVLCNRINNNKNVPFSKVTYKAEFGIYTNGSSRYTYGRIGYVIDGEWLDDGNYTPAESNYWSVLRQNGEDLIFFSTNNIFRTDITGSYSNIFIPECFKLSAFKNLDTGEEYIAQGDLYVGFDPSYTKSIGGYWSTPRLANEPHIPSYRTGSNGTYNDYNQYIYLSPDCVATGENGSSCASFDFSMKANNGDEYHVIVENALGGVSVAKIINATGNFVNTQVGYDQNNRSYIYLNTPSGTSDFINFEFSIIGTYGNDAQCYFYSPYGAFTPIAETRVGGVINKNNLGHIEQYIGETTARYTNGYFYKATGTEIFTPESIECEKHTGEGGDIITINDINGFINTISNYIGWDTNYIKSLLNHDLWRFYQGYDGYVSFYWWQYGSIEGAFAQELYSYMTFDPAVQEDYSVEYYVTYTPGQRELVDTYWEQVNVQPGSGSHEPITPGTHTKITYNSDGLVIGGGDLNQSDIPVLPLTKISGVVATAEEVNKLHGLTPTTTELNYVNGVTSNIQNQLTNKVIFRNWN